MVVNVVFFLHMFHVTEHSPLWLSALFVTVGLNHCALSSERLQTDPDSELCALLLLYTFVHSSFFAPLTF